MSRITLRSRFLAVPATVAAAGLLAGPAGAQRGFADVEVTAEHVAGSVHMLTGAGGNIGVSTGDDGVLIGHLEGGHTDGDSFIYFMDSNVIHLGDQFFAGRFPFVDVASGGNAVGLRDSIGGVLDRLPEDARVIPGHGPLSSVDDLRKYHRMLTECVATVQAGREAGKSLEDIQAAGLPDEWEGWGSGFINESVFIASIHESL